MQRHEDAAANAPLPEASSGPALPADAPIPKHSSGPALPADAPVPKHSSGPAPPANAPIPKTSSGSARPPLTKASSGTALPADAPTLSQACPSSPSIEDTQLGEIGAVSTQLEAAVSPLSHHGSTAAAEASPKAEQTAMAKAANPVPPPPKQAATTAAPATGNADTSMGLALACIPPKASPQPSATPPAKKPQDAQPRKIATPQQATTAVKTSSAAVAIHKPESVPKAEPAAPQADQAPQAMENENAKLLAMALERIKSLETELKEVRDAANHKSATHGNDAVETPKHRQPVISPPPSTHLLRSGSTASWEELQDAQDTAEGGEEDMVTMPDGRKVACIYIASLHCSRRLQHTEIKDPYVSCTCDSLAKPCKQKHMGWGSIQTISVYIHTYTYHVYDYVYSSFSIYVNTIYMYNHTCMYTR